MKRLALAAFSAVVCFAESQPKPVCNSHSQGRFFPEEANAGQQAVREYYQRGELEMCAYAGWKYKWERISVSVQDLAKGKGSSGTLSKAATPEQTEKRP